MSTRSAKPKVKKPSISKVIKELDKEHKGEPPLWDAIVDANRSGSLHFGKSITFMYPASKEMREKIRTHPELIDNLIISRHMYFSEKGADPESRWRCWIQFATEGEKVTATDSHMRIVANVSSATGKSIELAGVGKLELASSWDYTNNDQAFYMLTGTPDKVPKGKDRVFVEGAMEKEMLEGLDGSKWRENREKEMADHPDKWSDFRIKLEAFARTSLAYDIEKGFNRTSSAYCQYVVSFLKYLEKENVEYFKKAKDCMSSSALVSFYLILFTIEGIETTVAGWGGSLNECCSAKENCVNEYLKYFNKSTCDKSYDEYVAQLMKVKPSSSTTAIIGNMESAGWTEDQLYRAYIIFKLTEFLQRLDAPGTPGGLKKDLVSETVGEPSEFNYLISVELEWTDSKKVLETLDRSTLIALVRNLPQTPPIKNEVMNQLEEDSGKMGDPVMSPVTDLEALRKKMFKEYTL